MGQEAWSLKGQGPSQVEQNKQEFLSKDSGEGISGQRER